MTAPPSIENVLPVAEYLERVPPEAARLSRLAFDARLQRWLRHVLADRMLTVSPATAERWPMRLDIDTGQGHMQLSFDAAEWPALRMALDLADDKCACAVASALLAPGTQALVLAAGAGPARVAARECRTGGEALPALAAVDAADVRVAVHSIDDLLADRLCAALADVPAAVQRRFGGLRIGGRLRVLTRTFRTDVLFSLQPGDTVLLDANDTTPNVFRTLYGKGVTMQFDSEAQLHTGTVVAKAPPALEDENDDGVDAGADPVSELQVPVAFEVDTARITLGELASIRPGYVIELDRPLASATVRLVCHGQTVGHGQLVAVGGQMGVRIIRMGLRHDANAHR